LAVEANQDAAEWGDARTCPASPNWPCRRVPPNANAAAIISAAAPTMTTI
jgi:hypothetical protein